MLKMGWALTADSFPQPRFKRRGLQGSEPVTKLIAPAVLSDKGLLLPG
jgi:hypothetical protein